MRLLPKGKTVAVVGTEHGRTVIAGGKGKQVAVHQPIIDTSERREQAISVVSVTPTGQVGRTSNVGVDFIQRISIAIYVRATAAITSKDTPTTASSVCILLNVWL